MAKRYAHPIRMTHIPVRVLSDSRLSRVGARASGVYTALLCLMTQSETYGELSLSLDEFNEDGVVSSYANKLSSVTGWDTKETEVALLDLLSAKLIVIEDARLSSPSLIHIDDVSKKRAKIGKNGGEKTKKRVFSVVSEPVQETLPAPETETPPVEVKAKQSAKNKPVKHKYGMAKTVLLSDEEYEKLGQRVGIEHVPELIDILDGYKEARGMTYKSDYRAILNWVIEKYNDKQAKQYGRQAQKQSDTNRRLISYAETIARIDAENENK